MSRKEIILRHINKAGCGVEIGPSHNPIAPKREGYKVHVIDHMDQAQLIEKYKHHAVNTENIEAVDFVWQGEPYATLTGKEKYYDWVIASHMIEHTPDLIGFLNDCDTILKDDGVIFLVVPDKRYCFDHYRPITGLAKIIDSHFHKNTIHTPGTVAEFFLNAVAKAENIAWIPGTMGDYKNVHTLEQAKQGMKSVLEQSAYLDVHAWCFVPHSFRLIIHDLFCLGLIPFQEIDFCETQGHEFYITLGRTGQGITQSRLALLKRVESEIKDSGEILKSFPATQITQGKQLIKRIVKRFV
ncbi:MAG: methyltransferase domain-containing protein [Cyanobacteria bacterium P01_D01_bin.44]